MSCDEHGTGYEAWELARELPNWADMRNGPPEYAERLDALHQALVDDFTSIVERLPLTGGETIIDAGCGDGFFSGLLAERLPKGQVIGIDASTAFLAAAEQRLREPIAHRRVRLVEGDVTKLPFEEASVDAVWSGHSMQSYPHIPHVLAEFRRVLRPGGLLAILETDNIHSIMLSWPPDLELTVRRAEHREIGSEDSYIGTYFPRFAQRLLAAAGYEGLSWEFVFIQKHQPCNGELERYVRLYLEKLLADHGDQLSEQGRSRMKALATPGAARYLPAQENFFFGSLQALITARVGRRPI
ncbi:MAG TPA: class I SAM-dependent methyltransferase [Lacipirellula sp.]